MYQYFIGGAVGLLAGGLLGFQLFSEELPADIVPDPRADGTITLRVTNGLVDPESVEVELDSEGPAIGRKKPDKDTNVPREIGANLQFHTNPWTCTIWNGMKWVTVTNWPHPC